MTSLGPTWGGALVSEPFLHETPKSPCLDHSLPLWWMGSLASGGWELLCEFFSLFFKETVSSPSCCWDSGILSVNEVVLSVVIFSIVRIVICNRKQELAPSLKGDVGKEGKRICPITCGVTQKQDVGATQI